ncbi:LytTR family transcriptional regulator DNA-binding domain-containing protein [Aquimarina muelleri]|uniref:LytTR family transcriptional regulator DNA-binding domain-containing protein n=1 Tax=Aquimarina muelleri TaxID=279356 RepID=UPI003F688B51
MLLHSIIQIFNKPYPYLFSFQRNLIIAIVLGLLIYLVNLYTIEESYVTNHFIFSKFIVCLFAGLTTFFSILLIAEGVPRLFFKQNVKENWTIGKESLLIISLLFVIALFNNIMSFMLSKEHTSNTIIFSFLNSSLYVVIIGAIPATLIIWFNYTILLKENLKRVSLYNEQLTSRIKDTKPEIQNKIEIQTSNKNEVLELDINTFLFAKSEGNYTDVYTSISKKIECKPYRITIQKLEEVLQKYPFIISPHRSYIINIRNISTTSGNARNYRISFQGISHEVPVSRNKFQAFKNAFNQ